MKPKPTLPHLAGCLAMGLLALGSLPTGAVAQDAPSEAPATPDPITEAHRKATRDNQRVILRFGAGTDADQAVTAGLASRDMGRLVRYEYQVADVTADSPRGVALAKRFEVADDQRPALVILDAAGTKLHTLPAATLIADGGFQTAAVKEALEAHAAPQQQARTVLAKGLELAKNSERNAFIFLSAPW